MIVRQGADIVQFTRDSANRIASVVSAYENMPAPGSGPVFDALIQDGGRRGSPFRVGVFSGSWSKNATKTVTYKYQTAAPNTVTAMNLFAVVNTAGSSSVNCAIARDGTAWFLVAAEC